MNIYINIYYIYIYLYIFIYTQTIGDFSAGNKPFLFFNSSFHLDREHARSNLQVQTPEDAPARSAEEEGMGQSNQIMRAVSFAHEGWATVLVDQTPAQREKTWKNRKTAM